MVKSFKSLDRSGFKPVRFKPIVSDLIFVAPVLQHNQSFLSLDYLCFDTYDC